MLCEPGHFNGKPDKDLMMLTVTPTPATFEIEFNYNPKIIEAVKNIGGARWNPVRKIWTVTKDKQTEVERLVNRFGGSKVTERKQEFGLIPELPELTIDIPLKRSLFPFQSKGVAYCLDKKRVIMGDQPGLGKTSQAIAAIIAAKAFPALIICPSSLKINWQREWETVAGMKAMILTDKVKTSWPQYYRVGMVQVFIVNYESLKKYFVDSIDKVLDPEGNEMPLRLNHIHFRDTINLFKSVTIDELHRCKDSGAQQSKFTAGIAKNKELILGLTGTPVVNKPKDLISQLGIIGRLAEFGGYSYFLKRYCGGDGRGASNLEELNYKLATTCFYQRQKKDVLKELPDKMRQIVLCDITTRKEYAEAERNLKEYLLKWKNKSDAEVEKSLRGAIMVQMGILKNISARGKLNEVFEHIDEVLESGQKFGIFIHQKEIAAAIRRKYPHAVSITGDDSQEARDAAVTAFQNNPRVNLIICSIMAAGVGLTLTAASRMGMLEQPWTAAACDQCEDRFHRIGQKDSVQASYFLGKDTIDEYIYETIESKRSVSNTITGTVDNIQREIIDRLADSLFNTKNMEEQS
jgi:SWI/SNF-related matrix-associated actin-dependent regulator of chromatin subfamily A-like protein 1